MRNAHPDVCFERMWCTLRVVHWRLTKWHALNVWNATGTYRRVVHAGIDASAKAGEWTNPHNRTWTIDRAFGFSLTAGQVISITPARSRIIFEQDHFLDGCVSSPSHTHRNVSSWCCSLRPDAPKCSTVTFKV
jgi:hypothetical protein